MHSCAVFWVSKYLSRRLPFSEREAGIVTRHFLDPSWNDGNQSLRFLARFITAVYRIFLQKTPVFEYLSPSFSLVARSSSRLGHGPLKAGARVRVPYALPLRSKALADH
jgi:hypothetical protein